MIRWSLINFMMIAGFFVGCNDNKFAGKSKPQAQPTAAADPSPTPGSKDGKLGVADCTQGLKEFSSEIKFGALNINVGNSCGQGKACNKTEQDAEIPMPADIEKICKIEFVFVEPSFTYDDHVLLVVNSLVLAASNTPLIERLEKDGNFLKYDWQKIAGNSWQDKPQKTFCQGEGVGNASCIIPDSDQAPKPFTVILNADDTKLLGDNLISNQKAVFKFVTVGDTDDNTVKLKHSSLSAAIKISYSAMHLAEE